MERDVTIICGNVEVPLNPFTREIVANTVSALVGTLRKTEPDGEIVVRISPSRNRENRAHDEKEPG